MLQVSKRPLHKTSFLLLMPRGRPPSSDMTSATMTPPYPFNITCTIINNTSTLMIPVNGITQYTPSDPEVQFTTAPVEVSPTPRPRHSKADYM
jgi:hypothetical protein